MWISEKAVNEIKNAYESNKAILETMKAHYEQNPDEAEDPEGSFEEGYNNAIEYIANVAGIPL